MMGPPENDPDLLGTAEAIAAGSRVAGYLLEEQIGASGMAVVFRARDERLNRQVALKIMMPGFAADEVFRQRFIRESRAAAAVDDPHIIPVYEAGEATGVLFIAMRYVGGGNVRSLLQREGPQPPTRAVAIISAVASALDAAHGIGLIHRDVRPANMLLDRRPGRPDHVYLSDFGLSKGALSSVGLAGTGQFLGAPDYMAPEQIAGGVVDGRTDQYSLACATFELLSGAPPFQRDHEMAVVYAHSADTPPALTSRTSGLPTAVDAVLARALAKDPAHRHSNCQEFAELFRVALQPSPYRLQPEILHATNKRSHGAAIPPKAEIRGRRLLSAAALFLRVIRPPFVAQQSASLDEGRDDELQNILPVKDTTANAAMDRGSGRGGHHSAAKAKKARKTQKVSAFAAAAAAGMLIWYFTVPSHVTEPPVQDSQPSPSAGKSAGRTAQSPIRPTVYPIDGKYVDFIGMALDDGHLWILHEKESGRSSISYVTELDASNGQLIRTLSGRRYGFKRSLGITVGDGHVWVVNGRDSIHYIPGSVTELDPSNGRLVRILSGPGFEDPAQVAVGGGHVWVTNYNGNSVTELEASTGRLVQIISSGIYGFSLPWGIGIGGGHVWVTNNGSHSSVTELDAGSGRWVRTLSGRPYSFGAPTSVVVGAGHVWVINNQFGTLTELSEDNGRWVQTLVLDGADPGSSPAAIAVDGAHVWLTMMSSSYPSGAVIEFNASNGQLMRTLTGTNFRAEGPIVADRTHIWVISGGGRSGRSSLTEFPTK